MPAELGFPVIMAEFDIGAYRPPPGLSAGRWGGLMPAGLGFPVIMAQSYERRGKL
jgi:hypothetical protein